MDVSQCTTLRRRPCRTNDCGSVKLANDVTYKRYVFALYALKFKHTHFGAG